MTYQQKIISIFLGLFLLLTGCSAQKIEDVASRGPSFDLEAFFEGDSIAYGIFEDYSQSLSRQFRVNIKGTIDGDTLTLEEDFLYDDGETQRRVWVITNKGTTNEGVVLYEGRADDVIGTAQGELAGNALHWRYQLALPVDDTSYDIRFNDWIYKQDEDVALNRARLTKFGLEVGSVTLVFLRGKAARAIGPLDLENW